MSADEMDTALEFDQVRTESGMDAMETSCPVSGLDALIHPEGGYHVLRRVAGGYLAAGLKRVGRWDTATEPAWWQKADAARKWATREFPDTPTMIEGCDLNVAPCLLRPKRKGSRPVRISLEELQQATGLGLGKTRMIRRIVEAIQIVEALEAVDPEDEEAERVMDQTKMPAGTQPPAGDTRERISKGMKLTNPIKQEANPMNDVNQTGGHQTGGQSHE